MFSFRPRHAFIFACYDDVPMLKHIIRKYALIHFVLLLFVAVSSSSAKSIDIPLKADRWETRNDVRFVEHQGRESIHLKAGSRKVPSAELKDFELSDGIIEFDLSINVATSVFPGIDFRITEEMDTFERVYLRPGNTDQANSFQYHPVYLNQHPWQLYGQHQRDLHIPNNEWFHVKIDLAGQKMACYVHGQEYPLFWTEALQSGSASGRIRFFGQGDYYVSNLKVTKREQSDFGAFRSVSTTLPESYLDSWRVSPALPLEKDETSASLERFRTVSGEWKTLQAEAQGLINLTRHIQKNTGHVAILAKTSIPSDEAQSRKLFLGYSDRIDLFLNGKLIFSGDNTYRAESSKMGSRVHVSNDQIDIKLEAGVNTLEAIVYERFGGWALMARLDWPKK